MGESQLVYDLVTGGAGFVGSHLVDRLVSQGRRVMVVDSLDAGTERNLWQSRNQIAFVKADTREESWWPNPSDGRIARIFHFAANASVPRSSEDPNYDLSTNIEGTLNALKLAKRHDATFVYISSAAVYGNPQYVPIDENHPTVPISPYGTSKLSGELYVDLFRREHELETRIVRYFNCFGPRQPRYIVYDFLNKALGKANEFEVLGTGEQVRTQMFVTDAVAATLLVAEHGDHNPYNVGSDKSFTVLELAESLLGITGNTHKRIVTTGASWPGDIYTLLPDTSRLKALGFEPSVSLEEGLKGVLSWWRSANG